MLMLSFGYPHPLQRVDFYTCAFLKKIHISVRGLSVCPCLCKDEMRFHYLTKAYSHSHVWAEALFLLAESEQRLASTTTWLDTPTGVISVAICFPLNRNCLHDWCTPRFSAEDFKVREDPDISKTDLWRLSVIPWIEGSWWRQGFLSSECCCFLYHPERSPWKMRVIKKELG